MKSKLIQATIIGAIFIYIAYGVDIDKIDMSIISWIGVFITSFILFLGQLALSLRWQKMSKTSFEISYETITVSTALNMILPAKLGELSKALYMKKYYNYSFHKGISIVFVERLFDIVVLFLLLSFWAYLYFSSPAIKNGIISLSIFIVFTIFFFKSKTVLVLLKKIPFRFLRIYSQKIYKQVNSILKDPFSIFSITILTWAIYFFALYAFFTYAVDFHLTFQNLLELFLFSTIAFAVPLTPAGVGTFEAVVVLFLQTHGVGKEDAFVAATVYHLLMFFVYLALLLVLMYTKNIDFKEIINIKKK